MRFAALRRDPSGKPKVVVIFRGLLSIGAIAQWGWDVELRPIEAE